MKEKNEDYHQPNPPSNSFYFTFEITKTGGEATTQLCTSQNLQYIQNARKK